MRMEKTGIKAGSRRKRTKTQECTRGPLVADERESEEHNRRSHWSIALMLLLACLGGKRTPSIHPSLSSLAHFLIQCIPRHLDGRPHDRGGGDGRPTISLRGGSRSGRPHTNGQARREIARARAGAGSMAGRGGGTVGIVGRAGQAGQGRVGTPLLPRWAAAGGRL